VPQNKQLDRLAKLIREGEERLEASIITLQKTMKGLFGSGIVPPKPKKDLLRALERLRKALDSAIRSLERRIAGSQKRGGKKPAVRKVKSN
jgi:hypothetical protein